jgi:hypothetical protein
LFCGRDVALIISEDELDRVPEGLSAEQVLALLVQKGDKWIKCTACGRIALVRRKDDEVDFYQGEDSNA